MKPEASTAMSPRSACHRFPVGRVLMASLVFAGAMVAFSRDSRAEQFVVMDAAFTYTWDMAVNAKPSKSHFYVNDGNFLTKTRPTNWMSPIDYRNGTVHIRTEVI